MEDIIFGLAVISFLAFVVGMIKPQTVKMPNRIRAAMIYLGGFFFFAIIGAQFFGNAQNKAPQPQQNETVSASQPETPEFKYPRMTLKEYRNSPQYERQDIVKTYLASIPFDDSHFDIFYSCLSQMSYTKNTDLTLKEVLGWCKADFDRSVSALNDRINLDNFISKFSSFDGSYRPLEKQIKNDMNDSKNYSHESTTYRMDLNAKPPVATVITTFTGKNQYNATVKQKAVAKVDLITGDMLSYDYQQ